MIKEKEAERKATKEYNKFVALDTRIILVSTSDQTIQREMTNYDYGPTGRYTEKSGSLSARHE